MVGQLDLDSAKQPHAVLKPARPCLSAIHVYVWAGAKGETSSTKPPISHFCFFEPLLNQNPTEREQSSVKVFSYLYNVCFSLFFYILFAKKCSLTYSPFCCHGCSSSHSIQQHFIIMRNTSLVLVNRTVGLKLFRSSKLNKKVLVILSPTF